MNEDQSAKSEVKPVSAREFMQMASRASAEIKMLRNVIARLEPKADAYDRLSTILDMARPKGGFSSSEDIAYLLDTCIKEIAETLPKPIPGGENIDTVEVALAQALAAHKADIHGYIIARHFLITIAIQKMPSELGNPQEGDWKGCYETIVELARKTIDEIKATRVKAISKGTFSGMPTHYQELPTPPKEPTP